MRSPLARLVAGLVLSVPLVGVASAQDLADGAPVSLHCLRAHGPEDQLRAFWQMNDTDMLAALAVGTESASTTAIAATHRDIPLSRGQVWTESSAKSADGMTRDYQILRNEAGSQGADELVLQLSEQFTHQQGNMTLRGRSELSYTRPLDAAALPVIVRVHDGLLPESGWMAAGIVGEDLSAVPGQSLELHVVEVRGEGKVKPWTALSDPRVCAVEHVPSLLQQAGLQGVVRRSVRVSLPQAGRGGVTVRTNLPFASKALNTASSSEVESRLQVQWELKDGGAIRYSVSNSEAFADENGDPATVSMEWEGSAKMTAGEFEAQWRPAADVRWEPGAPDEAPSGWLLLFRLPK